MEVDKPVNRVIFIQKTVSLSGRITLDILEFAYFKKFCIKFFSKPYSKEVLDYKIKDLLYIFQTNIMFAIMTESNWLYG